MKPAFQRKDLHTIQTYLIINDVQELINFLEDIFHAEVQSFHKRDDGSIMHTEIRIGDSIIMAGEPTDNFDLMPASIFIYVEDCDATYTHALNYGCESIMPPETMKDAQERYGGVQDKNGNIWWISTHISTIQE